MTVGVGLEKRDRPVSGALLLENDESPLEKDFDAKAEGPPKRDAGAAGDAAGTDTVSDWAVVVGSVGLGLGVVRPPDNPGVPLVFPDANVDDEALVVWDGAAFAGISLSASASFDFPDNRDSVGPLVTWASEEDLGGSVGVVLVGGSGV